MRALRRRVVQPFAIGVLAVSAMTIAPSRSSAQPNFDHAAFDALLHAHVRNGMVDYDAFAAAPAFAAYLGQLAAFDPTPLSQSDQVAFWINAYNAYTIQLINAHHERESIRNINKALGFIKGYGPWKERIAVVGGTSYGLDDIEQDILRKRYHEPRIHVALVCAAMGCPPLRSEAYVGSRLDAQLDDQARTFVLHSPSKNRIDVAARIVYLSPIFVEFRDYINDFGGTEAAVGKFIARYYPAGAERDLLASGQYRVEKTPYDWTLNSQANARRAASH
ncbi:MAG: DUF547 domain-containing protein [Gemmatimonadota bacterium]|nr:DUF547 domain-containing protein [Gemmatimonadota bacterium]